MNNNLAKAARLVPVAVFLLGAITAGVGYAVKQTRTQLLGTQPRTGFKVTYNQTYTSADGREHEHAAVIERYEKADGSWKQVTTWLNPDGTVRSVSKVYGLNGRGVFRVNEKTKQLIFIGDRPAQMPDFSEAATRRDPTFIGDASMLGYKTLVLRTPFDGGSGYAEHHVAPALQGVYLKTVFNEGEINAIEAMKIEVGEPPANEFTDMPDYPVSYEEVQNRKGKR